MAEKRSSRGFTRVDALVAGVLCLVLVLLVPVLLAKPREQSVRTVCAANLAQIGKTMFIYANDYEGVLPRAGGRNSAWGTVANWMAMNRFQAFGLNAVAGEGGRATISSCFYLLVKYYETPTRLFLCRGDKGTTEFKLSNLGAALPTTFDLPDAWDFGPPDWAYRSCSFSYHHPFSQYALTTSRDPNLAVAADRNPWFKSPAGDSSVFAYFQPDIFPTSSSQRGRAGNAIAHQLDGQNVLFLDGRVAFETRSFCGRDRDNIYTMSGMTDTGHPMGVMPTTVQFPANAKDSFLVHDPGFYNPIPIHRP